MPSLPESLVSLITALGKLPGIGPRSAERIALHLVLAEPEMARHLAESIALARQKIEPCRVCGALTELQPCSFCADPRREGTTLCVVEQPTDIYPLEKSGAFHGRYHVLGGKISPLDGIEPDDLRIAELEARLRAGTIQEVIVALGTDVEGDATGHYLAQRLASLGVKVTRLAYGLPAGTGLEYADELTLSRALQGRRELER